MLQQFAFLLTLVLTFFCFLLDFAGVKYHCGLQQLKVVFQFYKVYMKFMLPPPPHKSHGPLILLSVPRMITGNHFQLSLKTQKHLLLPYISYYLLLFSFRNVSIHTLYDQNYTFRIRYLQKCISPDNFVSQFL